MATLESAYNPQYSENASILTGDYDRVTVEVEDSIDAEFWHGLLSGLCPQKNFHFDPYRTVLKEDGTEQRVSGKSRIIESAKTFNQWHIGCVDSDYDWLLSDYIRDGNAITDNKYLIQTYAYSIENLMCMSNTLGDFCQNMTEEATEFDFIDYITRLSQIIYPLLIWSVYLYSQDKKTFSPTSWRNILVNAEKDAEKSLALIAENTRTKVEELDKDFVSDIEEKDRMEVKLTEKKLFNRNDAYLFVRGHDLYDHLVNSVISPIIMHLREQHYEKQRESDNYHKSALREYQAKQKSVRKLLAKNYLYKGDIYDSISRDVSAIWKTD
ncbi:MAG: DUF4435 domain-containing protein [Prevotellaceae bacterium]|nr:DUF4435 domain-containing protein [Prevotellaceae bacterium]